MAIEIVDLPIDNMVIFHSYVGLPEGKKWDPTEFNVKKGTTDVGLS